MNIIDKPLNKPSNPNFSSGPCAKRPGWNINTLKESSIGRSHRSKECKYKLNEIIVKNGWAIAYRYYSKDYVEEELYAKTKKIGIWKGSFEEPYIYRKKNKE